MDLYCSNVQIKIYGQVIYKEFLDTSEGITCWAKKISSGKETQQT